MGLSDPPVPARLELHLCQARGLSSALLSSHGPQESPVEPHTQFPDSAAPLQHQVRRVGICYLCYAKPRQHQLRTVGIMLYLCHARSLQYQVRCVDIRLSILCITSAACGEKHVGMMLPVLCKTSAQSSEKYLQCTRKPNNSNSLCEMGCSGQCVRQGAFCEAQARVRLPPVTGCAVSTGATLGCTILSQQAGFMLTAFCIGHQQVALQLHPQAVCMKQHLI